MDFQLTEEQLMMQDMARRFALERIAPLVEEDEKVHRFRPEIVREMGERYGNLALMERGRRLGLGTALRDGLRAALEREPAPDFVVTMDGDLSHDPGELPSHRCSRRPPRRSQRRRWPPAPPANL